MRRSTRSAVQLMSRPRARQRVDDGGARAVELGADQQADAAHVADDRDAARRALEPGAQVLAHAPAVLEHAGVGERLAARRRRRRR